LKSFGIFYFHQFFYSVDNAEFAPRSRPAPQAPKKPFRLLYGETDYVLMDAKRIGNVGRYFNVTLLFGINVFSSHKITKNVS